MSGFLSDLQIKMVGDEDPPRYRLISSLIYKSDLLNGTVEVPINFETDFASTPRLPLVYLLFGGVACKEAVVHDWLYTCASVPRSMADAVFKEACEVEGVPLWRRWSMWAAVRVFGGAHYKG